MRRPRSCLAAAGLLALAHGCGSHDPSIETWALSPGRVGQPYEYRLEVSGPSDIEWSLADGRLPPGLSLSKLGRLSGTPEEAGRFDLTVEARAPSGTRDRKAFALVVGEGRPLTLHTTRLPDGVVGIEYEARLDATGGVPPYRWSVSAGALPEGLAFSADSSKARLMGLPRRPGLATFALEVRDDRGASVTRQVDLTITERKQPLRIETAALPDGRRGEPFRAEILSRGGTPGPLRWDLGEGELPPGLRLGFEGTPATTITGTPTLSGRYSFTVNALDGAGGVANRKFTVEIDADPLRLFPPVLAAAEVGSTYTATLAVTGGSGRRPRYRVASGRLPRGLHLEAGQLSGVPAEAGRFDVVLLAEDEATSATVAARIEVRDRLRLQPEVLEPAEVGVFASARVLAVGAPAGGECALEVADLPAGLEAAPEGCAVVFSGTPGEAGRFSIGVSATDGAGRSADGAVAWEIYPALRVATERLLDATAGEAYAASLAAEGGRPARRRWSIVDGKLPYGIGLDPEAGRLVGTATAAGRSSVVIGVRAARTATRAFTLTVHPGASPEVPSRGVASPEVSGSAVPSPEPELSTDAPARSGPSPSAAPPEPEAPVEPREGPKSPPSPPPEPPEAPVEPREGPVEPPEAPEDPPETPEAPPEAPEEPPEAPEEPPEAPEEPPEGPPEPPEGPPEEPPEGPPEPPEEPPEGPPEPPGDRQEEPREPPESPATPSEAGNSRSAPTSTLAEGAVTATAAGR